MAVTALLKHPDLFPSNWEQHSSEELYGIKHFKKVSKGFRMLLH